MFSCLTGFVLCIVTCGVNSILIGSLPNEQHGISGQFHILNSKTIYIEHFNYDGGGPGAYFYYYEPNDVVDTFGGGYKIPLPPEFGQSDGQLKRSTYTDVNITVTLPDGVTACDIGTFTVWCEPFRAIFTRVLIPRDIFVDNGEGDSCSLLTDICLADNPCVNGVCNLGSSPDQYTCNCTGTNYMGTNCSVCNVCPPGYTQMENCTCYKTHICVINNPCNNGATCIINDGNNNYTCDCINGYSGLNCTAPTNSSIMVSSMESSLVVTSTTIVIFLSSTTVLSSSSVTATVTESIPTTSQCDIPLYGLGATIIVVSLLLIISVIINIGQFIKIQKKNTVNLQNKGIETVQVLNQVDVKSNQAYGQLAGDKELEKKLNQ